MARSTREVRFNLTAKDRTKGAFLAVRNNLRSTGEAVTSVHAKLLGLAGIGGFGAILGGIVRTNMEFQRLRSSLKTVTGSADAGAEAFNKIKKFAVTTPFDLQEVTGAFIKLKAMGLDPSESALRSYGNTASAMGKRLDQMIEAVADAATGEFERLKEFGIKAKAQGDQVAFTFQGVTTTVGKNAREIEAYLRGIGDNNFGTAMADQMKNLGPAFSNLRMSFANLAVTIGEAGLNDMVRDMAIAITDMTNSLSDPVWQKTFKDFFGDIGELAGDIAEIWRAITFLQGRDMLDLWQSANPSQIGNAAIPGGYKLGDLNRSGGNLEYLQKIREIEAKNRDETAKKLDESNQIQREILEETKRKNNVAIAG